MVQNVLAALENNPTAKIGNRTNNLELVKDANGELSLKKVGFLTGLGRAIIRPIYHLIYALIRAFNWSKTPPHPELNDRIKKLFEGLYKVISNNNRNDLERLKNLRSRIVFREDCLDPISMDWVDKFKKEDLQFNPIINNGKKSNGNQPSDDFSRTQFFKNLSALYAGEPSALGLKDDLLRKAIVEIEDFEIALWLISKGATLDPSIQSPMVQKLQLLAPSIGVISIQKEELFHYAEVLGYGYKAANSFVLQGNTKEISKHLEASTVSVLPLLPVSHWQTEFFLTQHFPKLPQLWEQFLESFDSSRKVAFLKASNLQDAKASGLLISQKGEKILQKIQSGIEKVYRSDGFNSPLISGWLNVHKPQYVIIRSSGKEDSDTNANAGGNASIAFVKPEEKAISAGIGEVIASYYGIKSITQRLQAGDQSVFLESPFMPFILQEMFFEKPIPAASPVIARNEIPVSGVLFTRETGKADGVTTINCAFGSNEGVVASLVAVDTYQVFKGGIYPVIRDKKTRLALKQGEKELTQVENSKICRYAPTLPIAKLATDLKQTADRLSTYYGSPESPKSMDMEFTISFKKNKPVIYLLQIRPLMSPPTGPQHSVLDLEKLNQIPSDQKQKVSTFLDGGSYVRQITSLKTQVIVADTLPLALEAYQKHAEYANIQLIISKKSAPQTSHEAVTLRAAGVPVAICSVDQNIEQFLVQATPQKPFLFCPQRQAIVQGNYDALTIEGLVTYPGPLEYTTAVKGWKSSVIQIDESIVKDKVKEWGIVEGPHRSLEVLFDRLAMQEEIPAKQALGSILMILYRYWSQLKELDKEKQKELFSLIFDHMNLRVAPALKKYPPQSMNRLFHIKPLRALIFQVPNSEIVGGQSMKECLQYLKFSKKAQNILGKLGLAKTEQNLSLVGYGHAAFKEDTLHKWHQFVKQIAQSSNGVVTEFLLVMWTLQKMGLLAYWMNISFANSYSATSAYAELKSKLKQPGFKFIEEQYLKLDSQKKQISLWGNPSYVSSQLAKQSSNSSFLDAFVQEYNKPDQDSIIKYGLLQLLKDALRTEDETIKAITGSQEYAGKEKLQIQHFHQMVKNYFKFLETASEIAQPFETEIFKISQGNPETFHSFLNKLRDGCSYHFGFHDTYQSIGLNCLNVDHIPFHELALQKLVRAEFNVSALAIGSKVDRDFSAHWPKRLEEHFTTIHQSVENVIGFLSTQLGFQISILPPSVQNFANQLNSQFPQSQGQLVLRDQHTLEWIVSVPLRQHGGTIIVRLNHDTEEMELEVGVYGNEEHNRWKKIASLAVIGSNLLQLPFVSNLPPQLSYNDSKGVSFAYQIPKGSQINYAKLCQMLKVVFKDATMDGASSFVEVQRLVELFIPDFSFNSLPVESFSQMCFINYGILNDLKNQPNQKERAVQIAGYTLHALAKFNCPEFTPNYGNGFSQFNGNGFSQSMSALAVSILRQALQEGNMVDQIKLFFDSVGMRSSFPHVIDELGKFFLTPDQILQQMLDEKRLIDAYIFATKHSLDLKTVIISMGKMNLDELWKQFNELLSKNSALSSNEVTKVAELIVKQKEAPSKNQIESWVSLIFYPKVRPWIEKRYSQWVAEFDQKYKIFEENTLVRDHFEGNIQKLEQTDASNYLEMAYLSVLVLKGLAYQGDPINFSKGLSYVMPGFLGSSNYSYFPVNNYPDTTKPFKKAGLNLIKALPSLPKEEAISKLQQLMEFYSKNQQLPGTKAMMPVAYAIVGSLIKHIKPMPGDREKIIMQMIPSNIMRSGFKEWLDENRSKININ